MAEVLSKAKVMEQIKRKYGEDKLYFKSGVQDLRTQRITTGSLGLDDILGGGLGRGRLAQYYGAESGGKCVAKGTYLFLPDKGIVKIEDVISKEQLESLKEGETLRLSIPICSANEVGSRINSNVYTSAFYNGGIKKTKKIRTKYGFEVEGTLVHPILTNNNGIFRDVKMKDLKIGDYVAIQKPGYFSGWKGQLPVMEKTNFKNSKKKNSINAGTTFPRLMDENLATFLGYFVAEGHMEKNLFTISSGDKEIQNWIIDYSVREFNYEPKVKGIDIYFYNKRLCMFLNKLGIYPGVACEKLVPKCVLEGSYNERIGFLRAYFDGDGCIHVNKDRGHIEVTTASEELSKQIQLMLLCCDVLSNRTILWNKEYEKNYYRVSIYGSNVDTYMLRIGFRLLRKSRIFDYIPENLRKSSNELYPCWDILKEIKSGVTISLKDRKQNSFLSYFLPSYSKTHTPNLETIEKILRYLAPKKMTKKARIAFYKLNQLTGGVVWLPIEEIVKGKAQVYDLCVPETHRFIANGIVVHNTLLAMMAVKAALKRRENVLWVDAECTFEYDWAIKLGLGIESENFVLWRPETAQEAFDVMERMAKTKDFSLIVLDSVGMLASQAVVDGEMGKLHIASLAKILPDMLRRLVPVASISNTTFIFINHLTMKIGVMFGCFHYNARVLLEDGTTEKIGKIVTQKIEKRVMSWNVKKNRYEPRRILNYYKNGKAERFFTIKGNAPTRSGHFAFTVGDDHTIYVPNNSDNKKPYLQEVRASTLRVGDKVVCRVEKKLNSIQAELIVGGILGDGHVKKVGNRLRYVEGHRIQQLEYCRWKQLMLENVVGTSYYAKDGESYHFETTSLEELKEITGYVKRKGLVFVSSEFLEYLTIKAIAIWYQDDGSYHFKAYKKRSGGASRTYLYCQKLSKEDKEAIADKFVQLGLPRPIVSKAGFQYTDTSSREFHRRIACFIHPCMRYKLHPDFHNVEFDITYDNCAVKYTKGNLRETVYAKFKPEISLTEGVITAINEPKKTKSMHYKYDLEIEGNSNYFVDNVLVHNSPESYSGGQKLRHAYSTVCKISKKGGKDGKLVDSSGEQIGHICRVRLEKSKLSEPLRVVEFPIYYAKGIDTKAEVFEAAKRRGFIYKPNPDGKKWEVKNSQGEIVADENGENKIKERVTEDKELLKELYKMVLNTPLDDLSSLTLSEEEEAAELEADKMEAESLGMGKDIASSIKESEEKKETAEAEETSVEDLDEMNFQELKGKAKALGLKYVGISKANLSNSLKEALTK